MARPVSDFPLALKVSCSTLVTVDRRPGAGLIEELPLVDGDGAIDREREGADVVAHYPREGVGVVEHYGGAGSGCRRERGGAQRDGECNGPSTSARCAAT